LEKSASNNRLKCENNIERDDEETDVTSLVEYKMADL
jgi:hypothetical protein